jgi:hypothetical protein
LQRVVNPIRPRILFKVLFGGAALIRLAKHTEGFMRMEARWMTMWLTWSNAEMGAKKIIAVAER